MGSVLPHSNIYTFVNLDYSNQMFLYMVIFYDKNTVEICSGWFDDALQLNKCVCFWHHTWDQNAYVLRIFLREIFENGTYLHIKTE